ncbi:homeodomain-interacting protein kinase 2-like [Toxotes jaculatrix]|uniref:homeodomain-interacting protein kinase 2-like n=1 Tax=Toxotes jaculatrix TaxID=941984 RepID=UPI001B3A9688|nr:homeodomain-interacting protein kinase 2-like [Toxotes jaculatrix]
MARRGLPFMSSLYMKDQILHSNYKVKNYLGEGSYGKVFKCLKMDTKETVAVKVLRRNHLTYDEVNLLNSFRQKKLDRFNIVRFIESFRTTDNKTALAFEMLDLTLGNYFSHHSHFPLDKVRNIVQQMATALEALKDNEVIHSDIKLDNIMLVDRSEQPLRVKLIDFGLAFETWEADQGSKHQITHYRAPEIILGLPFSEAIDMWSLGVVMGHMLLGQALFPGKCEYDTLRCIVELLGVPPDCLLTAGMYTDKYFVKRPSGQWRLKTALEYWGASGYFSDKRSYHFRNLDDIKPLPLPNLMEVESEETEECIDLLKAMLKVDPDERITPREVLTHPFITRGTPFYYSLNHQSEPGPSKTVKAGTTQAAEKKPTKAAERKTIKAAEPRTRQANKTKRKTKTDKCTNGNCGTSSSPSFPLVILVRPAPPERCLVFDEDSWKQSEACPSDRPKHTSDNCPVDCSQGVKEPLSPIPETCNTEQEDQDITGRTPGDTEPKEKKEKGKKKGRKNGFKRFCSWMKRRFCCCISVSEDEN